MNYKDRGHKKGIADDISDHCVNQATLKITVKKRCFREVG
jgi:hypothetical protein